MIPEKMKVFLIFKITSDTFLIRFVSDCRMRLERTESMGTEVDKVYEKF